MTDTLNRSAAQLMADRPGLHRLLRAVELSGTPYMDAYSAFAKGAGDGGTVGSALRAGGIHSLSAISEDLTTLEKADQARDQINQAAVRQLDDAGSGFAPGGNPSSIPTGRQDTRPRVDGDTYAKIKEAAAKGQPDYGRLFQARQLDPSGAYEGPQGEQTFQAHDLRHADAGIDLVGTMGQDAGLQQVQQQAGRATQRLDAAIKAGKTPQERRRLLDAAVSQEMRQLTAPVAEPTTKQLEQIAAEESRVLREYAAQFGDQGPAVLKALETARITRHGELYPVTQP